MLSQDARDKANGSVTGNVPDRAPQLGDAALGHAPGVLTVIAELPSIENNQMEGEPGVKLAFLSGVNDEVRAEYEFRPLADMAIPRHITANVKGDLPNFTMSVDENGVVTNVGEHQSAWLRARAAAGHPENASLDDHFRQRIGSARLLAELVTKHVRPRL